MIVIYLNNKKKAEKLSKESIMFDNEECSIKWFSVRDGYGFVSSIHNPRLENVDIFLHCSKINQDDQSSSMQNVKPGDILFCDISQGTKGPQVEQINKYISVDRPPSVSAIVKCRGIVKWFNPKDDFGFVKLVEFLDYCSPVDNNSNNAINDTLGKDVFVPGKKLQMMGIKRSDLVQNRKCICFFRIDEQQNRVCENLIFEDY